MKLTKSQKDFIDKNYLQIPDIDQLTRSLFKDKTLDGRNKEGKAVASYMLESGYEYKTRIHKKAQKIELSQAQKKQVEDLCEDGLSSLQISQVVFQADIKNLSMEQRSVSDFIKEIKTKKKTKLKKKDYIPPKTESLVIDKINELCHEKVSIEKASRSDKECIKMTKKYLRSPRFVQIMNTYNCEDASLFESEFIRSVWNKPDLTVDEINLYINVCVDYINLKTIQRNMEKLNQMFDEVEDQTEMSVKLAEILKAKSSEYHQCEQRQESLIKKLNGDRSARMKNKEQKFASILNLVQSFQEEDERLRMIEIAEKQKMLVDQEIDKIEEMSSWKSRVLGLRREDVL